MTEKLKQVIKREMDGLPKENQEAIALVDWIKITEEIGKKYLFNESDLNDFQTQTLLVLIGVEDADFYSQNIENEVGTNKKTADQIAEEVLQKIFNPIGKALVDNLKKIALSKDANHEQNIGFILSGGNYSAFAEKEPPHKVVLPTEHKEDPYREKPE